jgi:phage antirepressor YoqD-like protein
MLLVPHDRKYGILLKQTKMVLDQLLGVKHTKLNQALLDKKYQYDNKCFDLYAQDQTRAIEFGVRAQDALNKLRMDSKKELLE